MKWNEKWEMMTTTAAVAVTADDDDDGLRKKKWNDDDDVAAADDDDDFRKKVENDYVDGDDDLNHLWSLGCFSRLLFLFILTAV